MSYVTLTHTETDVQPDCTVIFNAGRLTDDDRTDSRRVELTFDLCYYTRTGPHSDTEGIEALGYRVVPDNKWYADDFLVKRHEQWRATGYCPDSGFYIATQSPWLKGLPDWFHDGYRHYIVDGRDGYVELIAHAFKWREWLWHDGHPDETSLLAPPVAEGEGVA